MTQQPAPVFPWERVMAMAMGVMAWPPEVFWQATMAEFQIAMRGVRQRYLGADILDEADIAALRDLIAERK